MSQYEVSPPPAAWTSIAARLSDDVAYSELSERMHQFETTPPADAWNKIENALHTPAQKSGRLVPISKWMTNAASIAAIVAVMLGVWWWMKPQATNEKQPGVRKAATAVIPQAAAIPPPVNNPATEIIPPPRHANRTAIASNAVFKEEVPEPAFDTLASHRKPIAVVEKKPAHPAVMLAAQQSPDSSELILEIARELAFNSHYRISLSPDGRLTRTSYMLPDDTDKGNMTRAWKKQLKRWKKIIVSSGYTPSTGAFPDILELQQLFQEAQQ